MRQEITSESLFDSYTDDECEFCEFCGVDLSPGDSYDVNGNQVCYSCYADHEDVQDELAGLGEYGWPDDEEEDDLDLLDEEDELTFEELLEDEEI